MTSNQQIDAIEARIIELRAEHRALDETILHLSAAAQVDELQLRRQKKRKLLLRDQIAQLESTLVPDIPA